MFSINFCKSQVHELKIKHILLKINNKQIKTSDYCGFTPLTILLIMDDFPKLSQHFNLFIFIVFMTHIT